MKKDLISIIFISLLLMLVVYFFTTKDVCNRPEMVNFTDTTKLHVSEILYGFTCDSFQVTKSKVKRGDNLATILKPFGVTTEIIDEIANCSDSVFDLRQFRAGNKYAIFCSKDDIHKIQYFVYEHNQIEFIIFDLRDTINITRQEKDITTITRTELAEIKSSLWGAMQENNMNSAVALELAEVYAWTIDFFELQKGDYFKIIYDEQYVDSISIGVSKIQAICFNKAGENFYAFPFVEDEKLNYFDENGKSLKKAFLKAPLKFSRVSSRFSNSRMHPVLKIRRPHHGVDYAAPTGTPVYSIGNGKVIDCGRKGGAGNLVKIKHNSEFTTSYMHLSKFGNGIRQGKSVTQGDVIGYVGSTGLSSGPHLDFRVYKNGKATDPLKLISPPAEPVKKANIVAYKTMVNTLKPKLDSIVKSS